MVYLPILQTLILIAGDLALAALLQGRDSTCVTTMDNNNQTSRGSSKYRLLLVDDDNFTHEMMDLFLRNTEYVLISAFSTDEALRIIVSDAPDIVITDAMMPGESGFSLIDKIKARPASSKIPILLWTMLTQSDGSVMDASGKADIVIGKPIGEDARPTAPLMTR